jgi:hypothetical protein
MYSSCALSACILCLRCNWRLLSKLFLLWTGCLSSWSRIFARALISLSRASLSVIQPLTNTLDRSLLRSSDIERRRLFQDLSFAGHFLEAAGGCSHRGALMVAIAFNNIHLSVFSSLLYYHPIYSSYTHYRIRSTTSRSSYTICSEQGGRSQIDRPNHIL